MFLRRHSEAAQRFAERREREDEAARLREAVPGLASLRITIREQRDGGLISEASHVRLIVVDSAPALFVLGCGDKWCKDGGHDVTLAIVRALVGRATRFEGEHACQGYIGSGNCARVMCYAAVATYH